MRWWGYMEDYRLKYEKLKSEFESYQKDIDIKLQGLSDKNMKLEKDLNALANIVEISKYINSFLNNENLIAMINDMVLGLLGVAHSTIFLEEKGELVIKANNMQIDYIDLTDEEKAYINEGMSYLINSEEPIRRYKNFSLDIRSVMGMPIKIRDKYIGFILVEHHLYEFLDLELEKFLRAIANQIAISIENSMLYREIQETAKRDPLLGIYNRKHFFSLVNKKESKEPNKAYAIVMVDLDNFKMVNDNHGHQFGDQVLIESIEVIKNMLDDDDIIARYGGEEIIIYINKADDIRAVYEKVEAIRACVEKNKIIKDNISTGITASFGIGYYPKDGETVNDVIKIADKFLYKSKALGKNRVIISDLI